MRPSSAGAAPGAREAAAGGADKLVRMANQIAGFFRVYPAEEAAMGVRDHVIAFWTPGMRAALEAHVATGGEGVDPLVARALSARPEPGTVSPIEKELAGPATAGQLASDAG